MKEFGGHVDEVSYRGYKKPRDKYRLMSQPPDGPWTEELTMTLKLGRLPMNVQMDCDAEWWPLDPWHPNHIGIFRRGFRWNSKLRRFETE